MNSAMMPKPGNYFCEEIKAGEFARQLKEAKREGEVISSVGYPVMINLIEQLTGIQLPLSREATNIQHRDQCLVAKLKYRLESPKLKKVESPSIEDLVFFRIGYIDPTVKEAKGNRMRITAPPIQLPTPEPLALPEMSEETTRKLLVAFLASNDRFDYVSTDNAMNRFPELADQWERGEWNGDIYADLGSAMESYFHTVAKVDLSAWIDEEDMEDFVDFCIVHTKSAP